MATAAACAATATVTTTTTAAYNNNANFTKFSLNLSTDYLFNFVCISEVESQITEQN